LGVGSTVGVLVSTVCFNPITTEDSGCVGNIGSVGNLDADGEEDCHSIDRPSMRFVKAMPSGNFMTIDLLPFARRCRE
jgi:hypothetical protein